MDYQRWSRGHKARGQGQGHKKKSEAKAKDSLSEDRHSRGQGQECSRPRTKDQGHKAQVLSKKKGLHKNFSGDLQKKKKKKRSSQKFFKQSPLKNVFQKIFQALHKILTFQKIVLSSSRLSLPFYERNAIIRAGFTTRHSARAPLSDCKTVLFFTYIWQEDVAKISKIPEAPCNINSARE